MSQVYFSFPDFCIPHIKDLDWIALSVLITNYMNFSSPFAWHGLTTGGGAPAASEGGAGQSPSAGVADTGSSAQDWRGLFLTIILFPISRHHLEQFLNVYQVRHCTLNGSLTLETSCWSEHILYENENYSGFCSIGPLVNWGNWFIGAFHQELKHLDIEK